MLRLLSFIKIFILFFTINYTFSKDILISKNYDIMEILAYNFSDSLFNNCVINKYDTVNFNISKIKSAQLVERAFTNFCIDNDIFVFNDTNNVATHNIIINRFDVNYSNFLNDSDSLVRIVKISGYVSGNNAKYKNYYGLDLAYCDTISRVAVPFIENPAIDYTCSNVPQEEKTFFQKAVEPFILISSAIISVLILFSVRSN